MVIKKVFAAVLLATLTACNSSTSLLASQTVPIFSSSNATVQGATVEVRIETGTQLKTLAAKKTIADVDHYHIKLINTATNVVVAEGDSTDLVSFFHKMPNGTYKVNVDALDADGNSIVQGGAQDSSNTVTVASPNVTYSDGGPCLKVRLKLLSATGEKVGNKIIVEDGDEWTGTPELQPGGNCPCPTPTPTPVPTPTPTPSPIEIPGNIFTIAGGGTGGDGSLATDTVLGVPAFFHRDAQGNLFLPISDQNKVVMIPKNAGIYFGQSMLANHVYTIASGINQPATITTDRDGNVFVSNTVTYGSGTFELKMIPQVSGTYFGQVMTAHTPTTILTVSGFLGFRDMVADADGNLLYLDDTIGALRMLPRINGTYFGQAMTANVPTTLASGYSVPQGMALDAQGNVFWAGNFGAVDMLAKVSGTYFGQTVAANSIKRIVGPGTSTADGTPIASARVSPIGADVAFDSHGNMFISSSDTNAIYMVPKVTGTYFGIPMNANAMYRMAGTGTAGFSGDGGQARLAQLNFPIGLEVDNLNHILIADAYNMRIREVTGLPL
jgi:hypothetical protein